MSKKSEREAFQRGVATVMRAVIDALQQAKRFARAIDELSFCADEWGWRCPSHSDCLRCYQAHLASGDLPEKDNIA
jgi:hypothetical protein